MSKFPERRRNILICLCLAVGTLVVYWPVRHSQFVIYDDAIYVSENEHVQEGLTLHGLVWAFTTGHFENWHPLTWLSHMLDCQLFGLDAGAHHFVSVLIHVANALLLYFVLQRMTAAPWRSGLVAALFAWHPLHVESVAWVAERKDVLCGLFWMLTLLAYVQYVEQPSRRRYWLAVGVYALGLMSKPMVVTLPFVLLLMDDWPLGRRQWLGPFVDQPGRIPWHRLVMEKIPFFVLAAASCLVIFWLQYHGGDVAPLQKLPMDLRVANAVVAYVRYLGKAVWPVELAVFYPYRTWPWTIVLSAAAVLVGISSWVVWRGPRARYLLVGWLWYVGMLVPVIGLVQAGDQSMADRYSYLPLIGVFIMVVWGAQGLVVRWPSGKPVAAAAAVALLVVYAVASRAQLGYWENSEKLFRHALRVTENNLVAHYSLGQILLGDGRLEEATVEFQEALRIKPDYLEAINNLGLALARSGRTEEARIQYEKALQMNPNYVKAHNNLGLLLAGLGRTKEAMAEYAAALRVDPRCAEARNNLGNVRVQERDFEAAAAEYREALRINPRYAEARGNLGFALANLGTIPEAIAEYQEAVRLKPQYAEARYNLGLLLAAQGQTVAALAQYREAARLHAESGRLAEAVRAAQKALELAMASGQPELAGRIQQDLTSYQEGRSSRDGLAPQFP